eukprot:9559573-Prorocentrum_lima.AAC.1
MTSSLVGSEMCIRDRLNPERLRWTGCRLLLLSCTQPTGIVVDALSMSIACLLYTSDAADDM